MITSFRVGSNDESPVTTKQKSRKQIENELTRKLEKYAQLRYEMFQLVQELGVSQYRSNSATISYVKGSRSQYMRVDDVLQLASELGYESEFLDLLRERDRKSHWQIRFSKLK